MLQHLTLLKTIVLVNWFLRLTIAVVDENELLETPQMIEKYGYTAESHTVTTEDGYILTTHRITSSPESTTGGAKQVVFVQHGLSCSSYDWVVLGPGKALGFLLADAGFDVWLGNARGNSYSKQHKSLSTSSFEYWNFSFHEMGVHDLSASFDYILEKTGQTNLYYVGQSMGTTMFYVLMSMRPEYNIKVRYMCSLAPVAFMGNTTNYVLKYVIGSPITQTALTTLEYLGVWELLSRSTPRMYLTDIACRDGSPVQFVCSEIIFLNFGRDPAQLNNTALPVYYSHYPDGGSTKTMIHFGQLAGSGKFNQYDYRNLNNLMYGQSSPPPYNLSKITCAVALIRSNNDPIAVAQDVEMLNKSLPNSQGITVVEYEQFSHQDFIWGNNARASVYDIVIKKLKSTGN